MKPLSITLHPRKGETVATRWAVVQNRPYPDISGECSALKWRNHDGLFRSYGRDATGLPKIYTCHLLADGVAELPEDYNRTHLAGYEGRAGSFTLRGNDMGEISIEINTNPEWPKIRVRGFGCPTSSESAFINSNIVPPLLAYIHEHQAELREQAVAAVRKRMHDQIREKRAALDALEKQIAEAKF